MNKQRLKEHPKLILITILTTLCYLFEVYYFGFSSSLLLWLTLLLITAPLYILLQLLTFNSTRQSTFKLIFLIFISISFLILVLSPTYPTEGIGSELNHQNLLNILNSKKTYFFAANFYNNEEVLPEFFDQFLKLCDYLGYDNVYLSIYESNSSDQTKPLLNKFRILLNDKRIRNTIVTDESHSKPIFVGNERIRYLASVRNKTLEPLNDKQLDDEFNEFNHVVFFNDVYFDWFSVVRLIETKNGNYDQVCAFDYFKIGLYDTWVTRDSCGRRVKPVWPHFQDHHSIKLLREGKPIPVTSCWNGITSFDARWFVDRNNSENDIIRFRTLEECVTSECLLSSYDLHLKSKTSPEIYMNPVVPTGE